MKHFKKVISIAMLIVMMLSFASCSLTDEEVVITNENIKIGVLLIGSRENATGTTASCVNAIDELVGLDYGIKEERFKYAENIDPNDAEALNSAVKSLINFECNLIIASDPSYFEAIKPIADDKNNQDVKFLVFDSENYGSNVYGYKADTSAAVYFAGIAAGLKASELKVPLVGFLYENENDISAVNAFATGAKSVFADVKVQAIAGTDVTANVQKLINAGCVVLASDFESAEIAKITDESKLFFCGFGSDNYAEYKTSFLCAPIYTYTQYYIDVISSLVNETEMPALNGDYSTGATSLSDLNEKTVAAGTADAVNSAAKEFMNGNNASIKFDASSPAVNVIIVK